MDKDSKGMVLIILAAAIAVVVVMSSLYSYSGMTRPLTVVESNSMQHSSDTSYLGIIDTGDMVIMTSPDKKEVVSYIDGYNHGYSKFGSYGDVIIYYREGKNPVIHRAILWLDYADGKWSAPALKDYPSSLWYNEGSWNDLTGLLTLMNLPWRDTKINVSINLDSLESSGLAHSGYLTKGDNNKGFDQTSGVHNGLVETEELKAIAGLEIPWIGCIKLLLNHKNVNMIPKNSVPCLVVMLIDIITFIALISAISEYRARLKEEFWS